MSWTGSARRLAPLVLAAGWLTGTIGNAAADTRAPSQVAAIADRMLRTLAPTGTPTVTVFATTLGRAETIIFGTPQPRSQAERRAVELITVRGRLRRRGRPVGPALFGYTVWVPNGASTEGGILRGAPKRLARLGHGITYNLTLQQPASAMVTLRPLAGIGPVSLGESSATLHRALGPWLIGAGGTYEYALGATQLHVGLDQNHVQELVSDDSGAVLNGVRLDAGYRALLPQLHGWRSVRCPKEQRMLELTGPGGRITDLLFNGNRFDAVNIGAAGTGGCPPWPPSFLTSPVGQLPA
jgi:hypothetical protein